MCSFQSESLQISNKCAISISQLSNRIQPESPLVIRFRIIRANMERKANIVARDDGFHRNLSRKQFEAGIRIYILGLYLLPFYLVGLGI